MSIVTNVKDSTRHLAPGSQNWHNFPTSAGTPRFFTAAKGPRITDADGRDYTDVYCGSGTVVLGHADDYQISRVADILRLGATVSLRHPVEADLARRLVEYSPGAEYCHFFKTGSEAVHAAVRICVNESDRPAVATTTYHGWLLPFGPRRKVALDKTSKAGATGIAVHALDWQSDTLVEDFAAVAAECACIVVTPTAYTPDVSVVRRLLGVAVRAGTLVVFDEVKAAFRYAHPNVSRVWGHDPDLRIVAKAMGNGFPLAALLGGEDLLGRNSTLSIFSTYASEVVSLTAAMACLDRLENGAYDSFAASSRRLRRGLDQVGAPFGATTVGVDTFFRLELPPAVDPDLLCRELSNRGVLYHPLDEVLISAAHDAPVVDDLLEKFQASLGAALAAAATPFG